MKKYWKSMLTALVCFLIVVLLNFVLPRLLPGNPIAYLSGFAEEDMTPAQVQRYTEALHLNESLPRQFLHYLRSLADGTLGYSFKKEAVVSELIRGRIGCTLQITLPAFSSRCSSSSSSASAAAGSPTPASAPRAWPRGSRAFWRTGSGICFCRCSP